MTWPQVIGGLAGAGVVYTTCFLRLKNCCAERNQNTQCLPRFVSSVQPSRLERNPKEDAAEIKKIAQTMAGGQAALPPPHVKRLTIERQ